MNIASAWMNENSEDQIAFLKHGITIFEDIYDDFETKIKLNAIKPQSNIPIDPYADLLEKHSSFLQIESS